MSAPPPLSSNVISSITAAATVAPAGNFNYNSGYQQTTATNQQFYGQYTTGAAATNTQVGTTDSQSANKMNVATGYDVSTLI